MPERSSIRIGIAQFSPAWENVRHNQKLLSQYFAEASPCDLMILPECFSTGFSMNIDQYSETQSKQTLHWMKVQAQRYNFVIAGSIPFRDQKALKNRLLWVTPDGDTCYYDKKHVFSLAKEDQFFSPGNRRVIVPLKSCRFMLQICYDLRFPVFSRNKNDYDALIYVASWPKSRELAWQRLLQARALENCSYCIGVNRIGRDGNNIEYHGGSALYFADGTELVNAGNINGILYAEIFLDKLHAFRQKYPFLEDADPFTLC